MESNNAAAIIIARFEKSCLTSYISRFCDVVEHGKEQIFTIRLNGSHEVKFSVDDDNNVYFIPFHKFKFLINDNENLNKLMVRGMESIHNKTKPDQYYMSLFKFFINIVKYIDNNDEGYTIPYIQKSYIKNDMRRFMEKLDGYHKTKEYKDIISSINMKHIY